MLLAESNTTLNSRCCAINLNTLINLLSPTTVILETGMDRTRLTATCSSAHLAYFFSLHHLI